MAANKQIDLEKIEVEIACRVEKRQVVSSDFDVRIDLGPGLTRREKSILLNVARSCEVGKMLTGPMRYDYTLTE